MCHKSCLDYGKKVICAEEVSGKLVLEVGSHDVNGSLRDYIEQMNPISYMGVDIRNGPKVDRICDAGCLVEEFGENSFDLVLSTEMLEHVQYWRQAVSNMKRVLRPLGILVLTTRSKPFPLHSYPSDYWRFDLADMAEIFSDMESLNMERDPEIPGVFVKVRKPLDFKERDLENYNVWSMQ